MSAAFDANRWTRETFDTTMRMCADAGVDFDADLCDEVGVVLRAARIEGARAALEAAIAVVPGGSSCDPQRIADAIRELSPESIVEGMKP